MTNWATCSMEVLEAAADPSLRVRYVGLPEQDLHGDTVSVLQLVERGRSVEFVKARLEETCAEGDQLDGWMRFPPSDNAPIQYMYAHIEKDGEPIFTRWNNWMWNWWRIDNGKEPFNLGRTP